ncbi:MAG TPA: DUF2254 domain-containing protein [Halanaerobiales bacterium]|nr:DUF2254 domain-containing protein [Halanaerobiales bacterium]
MKIFNFNFLDDWRAKIYYIPVKYSIYALIISAAVLLLEQNYQPYLINILPNMFFTPLEITKTILSTIAGSLLSIVTISFSIIMVVLTTYSTQFSPRTLQDFLKSKLTLQTLGIFIGGFIYSIVTLMFLSSDGQTVFLSAAVGVIIVIFCLIYFVMFINHVSQSIQVNLLIDTLTTEILELVDNVKEFNEAHENIRNEPPANLDYILEKSQYSIYSKEVGFIRDINDLKLSKFADEHNIVINAERMIGDYVTNNTKVFTIYYDIEEMEMEELNEETLSKCLDFILVGKERNKSKDIEFGIQKLTEVALRAISPGINDPNTAIFCIKQAGMVLDKIAKANIENTYYYNEDDELTLIFEDISFDYLLYKTFYQLRYYSMRDVSVAASILEALIIIAEGNEQKIKDITWEFGNYIVQGFDENILEDLDKKYMNSKIEELAVMTEKSKGAGIYFE